MPFCDILSCKDAPFTNYIIHIGRNRRWKMSNDVLEAKLGRLKKRKRDQRLTSMMQEELKRRQDIRLQSKTLLQLRAVCKHFNAVLTTNQVLTRVAEGKIQFMESYDARISSSLSMITEQIKQKLLSSCVDSLNRPRISHLPSCVIRVMNEEVSRHTRFVEENVAKRRHVEDGLSGLDWIRIDYS